MTQHLVDYANCARQGFRSSESSLCCATAAAVHETLLRLRFVSPPQHTLTGTRIDCGVDAQTLEPTEFAEFYGELTAQPELREVP